MIVHYYKADPAYGQGVAKKLGLAIDQIAPLADLSLQELIQKTSEEGYTKAEQQSSLAAAAV